MRALTLSISTAASVSSSVKFLSVLRATGSDVSHLASAERQSLTFCRLCLGKFGLVQDAVVMLIGVILLTSVWGSTLQGWVIGYTISLFIYGIGVGGEYPLTSTRALESGPNGPSGTRDDRLHRGRNVVLAFLMQGWGQVANQVVLLILMVIFHDGPNRTAPPYTEKTGQLVYRVSFGFIAILHAWLAYYRFWRISDADEALRSHKKKLNTSGYDVASLKLIGGHYWHRLAATSGGWFMNDFFFYGNK